MAQGVSAVDSGYDVRQYRPADRDGVITLYEQLFDGDGQAWFSWKYEDNPYVDHVPMTVATDDGTVVAVKPAVAFHLAIRDRTVLALQPTDEMVHPDHRGRRLSSRMTDKLKRLYKNEEPELFFSFTHQRTLSESLEHGWQSIERVTTAYRIQRPAAMLDDDAGLPLRTKTKLLGKYWRAKNRFQDRRHRSGNRVKRYDRVPVSTLAKLARDHRPRGIHALRDPRYLSWRFENPDWSYSTYLTGSDEAYAAVVVGERHTDDQHVVALTDVYPPATSKRADAIERLVSTIVSDYRQADVLVTDGRILPDGVRKRAGFRVDDDRAPDRFSTPPTLVAWPATGEQPAEVDWTIEGMDLRDPDSWHLSLAERDAW